MRLLVQNTPSGWITTETFISWIKEIYIPHITRPDGSLRHGILLVDSYEGHKSEEIQIFLKNYPTIHLCIIPGGFTDKLQPLDLGINAIFKRYCKEMSLDFTNQQIMKIQTDNKDPKSQEMKRKNFELLMGNSLIYFILIIFFRRR